jgi:[ribosomal protein S5]-alanine N-acetyltransferase
MRRRQSAELSGMSAEGMVLKAPLHVETARLTLAAPTAADADAVFERYASDPEVTRYLGWPRHQSVADTRGFLAYCAAEWERWPAGPYLIRARSNGQLLGSTGLAFERPDEAMTGYVLAKDAWGNGYATEALGAIVDVSRRIGLVRIYALCHPQHRASWRVLEKCAFTLDGNWRRQAEFPNLAPGVLQDVACYERVLKIRRRDAG